jgi:hypothetical protein
LCQGDGLPATNGVCHDCRDTDIVLLAVLVPLGAVVQVDVPNGAVEPVLGPMSSWACNRSHSHSRWAARSAATHGPTPTSHTAVIARTAHRAHVLVLNAYRGFTRTCSIKRGDWPPSTGSRFDKAILYFAPPQHPLPLRAASSRSASPERSSQEPPQAEVGHREARGRNQPSAKCRRQFPG